MLPCYIRLIQSTRRRTGISGHTEGKVSQVNWEAGVVYRLIGKEREVISTLLGFAGDAVDLKTGETLRTIEPDHSPEPLTPNFLEEITARGTTIRLQFQEGSSLPKDLKIRMPDRLHPERFFVLFNFQTPPGHDSLTREIAECSVEGENGEPVGERNLSASVEVSWAATIAVFPVRFDDKASLPPTLGGRRLTEAELLEYFLTGREPYSDGFTPDGGGGAPAVSVNSADTARILSYFVRRFVEALPGIEARIVSTLHSSAGFGCRTSGPEWGS